MLNPYKKDTLIRGGLFALLNTALLGLVLFSYMIGAGDISFMDPLGWVYYLCSALRADIDSCVIVFGMKLGILVLDVFRPVRITALDALERLRCRIENKSACAAPADYSQFLLSLSIIDLQHYISSCNKIVV